MDRPARTIPSLRRWLEGVLTHRRADASARHNRNEGSHCFYCGVGFGEESTVQRTIDHRVPRSRGGSNVLANLVFACRACNERKADGDEDEFVASAWLADRRSAHGQATDDAG